MKNIICLFLLIISFQGFSQTLTPPVTPGVTGRSTLPVEDKYLFARQHFGLPRYTDTTQANTYNGLVDSCGAMFFSYTEMAVWFRSCSGGRKWVMLDPSGIPSTSNSWVIGGNLGLFTSPVDPQIIGLKTNQGLSLMSNNITRVTLPAAGLTLLTAASDTTLNKPMTYNTSTKEWNYGYWFGSGGGGSGWGLTGNSGTTAGTNFIGTTDAQDFVGKANNTEQIRLLSTGGINIPTTVDSTDGVIFKGSDRFIHNFSLPGTSTSFFGKSLYIGRKSGNFTMTGSVGGYGGRNTAVGDSTLFANTTGYRNTAIGIWAGAANTSGFENTVVGGNAFEKNTTAWQNTAIGAISLQYNTTGQGNTAVGVSSLQFNITGERNTAIGVRAMTNSSTSFANVAVGLDALSYNTTADHNVGVGLDALYYSNGTHNVAVGDSTLWGLYALGTKHMGYKNTAIGSRAGYHLGDTYTNFASIFDTAVTFLGANASRDSSIAYTTSLQNMTVIGYDARGFASNQVVLGNDNVTSTLLKGALNARGYGTGAYTGTATYALQVDASGNIIEGSVGDGDTWQNTLSATNGRILTEHNEVYHNDLLFALSANGGDKRTYFSLQPYDSTIHLEVRSGAGASLSGIFLDGIDSSLSLISSSNKVKVATTHSATNPAELMMVKDTTTDIISHRAIPSSSTPTWQQTLTAGSTLTGTNTIDGGGNSIYFENLSDIHFEAVGIYPTTAPFMEFISVNATTNRESSIDIQDDSINIKPSLGQLHIDTLNYSDAADDSMMVWSNVNGGAVGMRAIPSGGSGANTALSNLASVAINTSLISDANNTDDLGDATNSWKDLFVRNIKVDGSSSGTATIVAPAVAGTPTLTLPTSTGTLALTSDIPAAGVTTMAAIGSSPNANGATISGSTLNLEPASASFGGVVTTGAQTFAGVKTLTSPIFITPALGTPASGTVTNLTGTASININGTVGATTPTTATFTTPTANTSIELSHATANTLTASGGQLSIEGVAIPTISSTNTITNKRWTARVGSTTSSATPTINTDNTDIYKLTAQTADITSFTTNLSGTPVDGDILEIQITGTAARAITWGASFVSSTVTLPATTVTTATLTVILQYFTTSSYGNNKWVCVNSF